ncbi:MAG: asparaginase [Ilumatobacteraceae bacterium]
MGQDPQGPALSGVDRRRAAANDADADDADDAETVATAEQYVPVAVTERSGMIESVHHGAAVALDADGRVAWTVGDPGAMVYARSALKPLQAAAMVGAGLDVEGRLLALVCASHDGRPEHVAAVGQLLATAGLDAAALDNVPAWPLDPAAHDDAVRNGGAPAAILQNCSGKHAGMLVTSVVNGWSTAGYAQVEHPVQQMILSALIESVGEVGHVGVDGCGAPAPMVSLLALAGAVRELAVERHAVHTAMTSHPELVGGPDRDVTALMRLVPGLLVKDGAEGVQVAALPDGRAVALKIADGSGRPRTPVMIAALRSLGLDLAADAVPELILGHGRPVGVVRSLVGLP